MGSYLIDNPPVRSQFRRPRREKPSGVVVVHTAENTPDFVLPDGGAEGVARFIRNRPDPGSYHDIADSDSLINLVPYDAEAYQDGTGSNPHAYAISGATRASLWPNAPAEWVRGIVANMARGARNYADWLFANHGIVIPARRITRAESELRIPGFISHAERDPARRSDPGAQFPWDMFFAEYDNNPTPTLPQEDDMHILMWNGNNYSDESTEIHDLHYDPPRSLGKGAIAKYRAQFLIDIGVAIVGSNKAPFPDQHDLVRQLGGTRS